MFLLRKLEGLLMRTKQNSSQFLSTSGTMSNPIVTVKEGKLKGATKKLLDGSTYYSFKGIPYAQPPIGKLRFKAPLPPKPWEGIHEAIEHGAVCPQADITTMQLVEGSENCLFLNVYSKSLQPDAKQPVMVFIHGGAYMSGSGDTDTLGPEFLIQHDVILVTINYRLEVLGFLCLDTADVPGNAGMKDQVAALRWVQSNIAQFGGDPNNVTIFGESAGSASVTQHMISPMSKGLFHKAIAQSGTCLEDWSIGRKAKERAFRAARYLGNETENVDELLEFLQGEPATNLAHLTMKTRTPDEKFRGLPIHFTPVVEKPFDNVDRFLDEEPIDKVLTNKIHKVPLMIGYVSHEGLLMLADRLRKADLYNKESHYLVPRDIATKLSDEKRKEFGERILRFYTGDKGISSETAEAIVDMQTDLNFAYNTHRFAHYYSATNEPIYLYRFSFDTELNFIKSIAVGQSQVDMKGACHADDLFYLFNNEMNKDFIEKKDYLQKIVFDVTKLWTDFAKTGNPTPGDSSVRWAPYTRAGKEFLDLNHSMTPGHNPEGPRIDFWNKLYCDAGLPCITKSTL
ncbi:carboxylic ester hydrolase-like [Ostrinia nubilalis]|uniref:carboxylic ester hydrolase-like n=1 Tax=Ostrinia nubilalis TaxID=29057 RepID=UPI0030824FAF